MVEVEGKNKSEDLEDYVSISELKRICGFDTEKEVLTNALTVFSSVVRRVSEGNTVEFIDEEKKTRRELILPVFSVLQDKAE